MNDRRSGAGFELFEDLPDNEQISSDPFVRPRYARDPRVDARSPHGQTVGSEPGTHTARHGVPAFVLEDAQAAGAFVAEQPDQFVRPGDASEALAWREVMTSSEIPTPIRGSDGFAVQLARIDVPRWATVTVERLATYVRATPLDTGGQPAGPEFVTGCCVDPFHEFVHPGDQSTISLRWTLAAMGDEDPDLAIGEPGSHVPTRPLQIEPHWSDLRYAYGSRYSQTLQLIVPAAASSVRLFATVTAPGSWRLRVGGRLGIWWVSGGTHRRAFANATTRVGG